MIQTIDGPISTDTVAAKAANRNWTANLRALRVSQPSLAADLQAMPADVEWVLGRDASLTALDADGRWWKGCSLPSRAAEFMLRKANLDGTVPCFLFPSHAAQLRIALDRMTPGQALLAITPDLLTARMILACEDFSADIDSHRLYFAVGDEWEAQLDQLLAQHPGLPTPTQFIRPILADSAPADALIAPAQKIFADHSNRRAQHVKTIRENWQSTGVSRICLVAPANFRLWDNPGDALAEAMKEIPADISISRFNPDDPATASAAALAAAAAKCDAIVMPNLGRADVLDLIPDSMPIATWMTSPRIPSARKAGPNDTLLVADVNWKTLAIADGWKAQRVIVASWPAVKRRLSDESPMFGVFQIKPSPAVVIISDTQPLDPPARVVEYSSHRLLWEAIREELLSDPFALGESADAYLNRRMIMARVDNEGFDRPAFLDGVILHAWQQGLARILMGENLRLKLFGAGWEKLDEFRNIAAGTVGNREQFTAAVDSAVALVHAWPRPGAHPIDVTGKPVIRPGKRREAFVRDARLALEGKSTPIRLPPNGLTGRIILDTLNHGRP